MEGRVVVRGESGVMCVRGDSQTPRYWRRPDKTAETMRDSWIWTGDRFREDADGFYTFEGRADDLVKVSGQWVYPLEIERCLAEHPLVQECAVMAVEDENKLTTIAAYVALRDGRAGDATTTKELQAFVKKQLLPYHTRGWCPTWIHCRKRERERSIGNVYARRQPGTEAARRFVPRRE